MRTRERPEVKKLTSGKGYSNKGKPVVALQVDRDNIRHLFAQLTVMARHVVQSCADEYKETGRLSAEQYDLLALFVGYAINARKIQLDNKKIKLGSDTVEICKSKTGMTATDLLRVVTDATKNASRLA